MIEAAAACSVFPATLMTTSMVKLVRRREQPRMACRGLKSECSGPDNIKHYDLIVFRRSTDHGRTALRAKWPPRVPNTTPKKRIANGRVLN